MATTKVFLKNVTLSCRIGVPKTERDEPQDVIVNVTCDLGPIPITRDRIGETINYAEIHADMYTLVAEHRYRLLEVLVEAIAHLCLRDRRVQSVTISAEKPNKLPNCASVGVERTFFQAEVIQ